MGYWLYLSSSLTTVFSSQSTSIGWIGMVIWNGITSSWSSFIWSLFRSVSVQPGNVGAGLDCCLLRSAWVTALPQRLDASPVGATTCLRIGFGTFISEWALLNFFSKLLWY